VQSINSFVILVGFVLGSVLSVRSFLVVSSFCLALTVSVLVWGETMQCKVHLKKKKKSRTTTKRHKPPQRNTPHPPVLTVAVLLREAHGVPGFRIQRLLLIKSAAKLLAFLKVICSGMEKTFHAALWCVVNKPD